MKFIYGMQDKNQSFLQIDTVILGGCSQACPKYPKWEVCISLQYLLKNMEDEVCYFFAIS